MPDDQQDCRQHCQQRRRQKHQQPRAALAGADAEGGGGARHSQQQVVAVDRGVHDMPLAVCQLPDGGLTAAPVQQADGDFRALRRVDPGEGFL